MNPTYVIVIVLGLLLLFASFFTVKQQTSAIIERFGRFQSIRQSGLQIKIPVIDRIAGRLSLFPCQLTTALELEANIVHRLN